LRDEIARIERGAPGSFVSSAALRRRSVHSGQAAGAFELDSEATHEIKPAVADSAVAAAAGFAAALAFALRLAAKVQAQGASSPGMILIGAASNLLREAGRLYGPGLNSLGLAPSRLLIVETTKPQETLWAMEEGLKSQALSAVVGCLDEVGLTPARRLSLAAKAYATPCLFVTHAGTPAAGATARRWRVGMRPGCPSPFDQYAPGDGSSVVVVEKLRSPSRVPGRGLHCVPGDGFHGSRAGILQAGRFRDLSAGADGQDPGNRTSVTKPVSGDAIFRVVSG